MGVFKKSSQQQIIKEADKITALVEDLNAMSWDRVDEIGKLLQNNPSQKECELWGRELSSIAQANISVLYKIGVSAASFSGNLMPSGIEILNDGQTAPRSVVKDIPPEESEVQIELRNAQTEELIDFFDGATIGRHEFIPRGNAHSEERPPVKGTKTQKTVPLDPIQPVEDLQSTQGDMEPSLEATREMSDPGKEEASHLKQIYKSKDGNLCIYEDETGHFVAIDAQKLT